MDDSNGAVADDVLSGKRYWGLKAGEWGPRTGKMTDREGGNASTAQTSVGGVNYFTAPEGYYDGPEKRADAK